MNTALTEAIKEAYASCPTTVTVLETLQVSHPSIANDVFIVKDLVDRTLRLETMVSKLFTACAFAINLPQSGENGVQTLNIRIDNTTRAVSDFLELAVDSQYPVRVTYRPYLSTDLLTPQMNPPLQLDLIDVEVKGAEVVGRATFVDVVNRQYLTERYTRDKFPSLGTNG